VVAKTASADTFARDSFKEFQDHLKKIQKELVLMLLGIGAHPAGEMC